MRTLREVRNFAWNRPTMICECSVSKWPSITAQSHWLYKKYSDLLAKRKVFLTVGTFKQHTTIYIYKNKCRGTKWRNVNNEMNDTCSWNGILTLVIVGMHGIPKTNTRARITCYVMYHWRRQRSHVPRQWVLKVEAEPTPNPAHLHQTRIIFATHHTPVMCRATHNTPVICRATHNTPVAAREWALICCCVFNTFHRM